MTSTKTSQPVKKRIISLDALRGFALLGIAAANFPEFSLWTFLDEESQLKMKTGSLDIIVRALLTVNSTRYFQYYLGLDFQS